MKLIAREADQSRNDTDITRLSYWFPKLQAAGLPVPRTIIVEAHDAELREIYKLFDGKTPGDAVNPFIERIKSAADEIGYPCFLRTDHMSAKHEWADTCHLESPDVILSHVFSIIYFWECVNFAAPKCDVWAVREFLPTRPVGVCRDYKNMPVCREFRFFVDGPEVKCWHPYWPLSALEQGKAEYHADFNYEEFCTTPDIEYLYKLASAAGKAVDGGWSVDILETRRGWYITDMAEAYKSFHWEGCRNNTSKNG